MSDAKLRLVHRLPQREGRCVGLISWRGCVMVIMESGSVFELTYSQEKDLYSNVPVFWEKPNEPTE